MKIHENALSVFPDRLKKPLHKAVNIFGDIYEIRLICEGCVYLYTPCGIRFVDREGSLSTALTSAALVPRRQELEEIVERALGYSGFSREKEVAQGYITYGAGIRMGLACDGEDESMGVGKIISLCIRIPYTGKVHPTVDYRRLLDFEAGLLIAGAPASGKTTLLRGIAEYLGSGKKGKYNKVCLIDERNELYRDISSGATIDAVRGKSKAQAISHAVRVLSPEYIICDEIGSRQESESLLEGLHCGVRFICSIHAGSLGSLIRRGQFRLMFNESVFDRVAVLSSEKAGEVSRIYSYDEVAREISRSYGNFPCNSPYGDISVGNS